MGFSGVLGHELCGVVEACEQAHFVGRRVAGEINLACYACELCQKDLARHCKQRTVMGILGKDGCFAEYVTLPAVNFFSVRAHSLYLLEVEMRNLCVRVSGTRACFGAGRQGVVSLFGNEILEFALH